VANYQRDLIELAEQFTNELMGDSSEDLVIRVFSKTDCVCASWVRKDVRDRILMALVEACTIGRTFERESD
jgi:hypothetical protein